MKMYVATAPVDFSEIQKEVKEPPKNTVELKEILDSINKEIKASIEAESDVTIVISGSVTVSGSGGLNIGIFNLGGEGNKQKTVTISLSTKIKPEG